MKKMWRILSLLCACILLFTACSVTDNNVEKTTEAGTDVSTVETSALSKEEQEQLQQDIKLAEEKIKGILNAKTAEDVYKNAGSLPEEYVKNVLEKFPDDDYTVTAEKLGVFEKNDVYFFSINRTSDADYENAVIELFVKTDGDYLLNSDEEIRARLEKKHACPSCRGLGFIIVNGDTCPVCDGTLMEYNEKAYYDKELKAWQGQMQECTGCNGTGKAIDTAIDCETCKGKIFIFS